MMVRRTCLGVLLATLVLVALGREAFAGVVLPVPLTVIYPGEVIDESMIVERSVAAPRVGRYLMVPEKSALVGKVARRTLLPGRPVPAIAVEIPDLVARGAAVRIVFHEGGLMIQAQATALEPGSAGDLIRVRNRGSGRTLDATVQADGTVRVGGP